LKLRILHTEASSGWGGQEVRILDEAAGLIARGHQVELAAPAHAPIVEAARKRGIPVHMIPIDRRSPGALYALGAVVARVKPDVIVTHSSTDSWLAALVNWFRRSGPAIVRTRHLGIKIKGGLFNRWLYGQVPAFVVTTGLATRKMLIDTLHIDPDKIVSIPSGTDTRRFTPGDRAAARKHLGLPADDHIIGIVATLRRGKGHRFLISALLDGRLTDCKLIIVGDGPQESALRALATELGIAGRVLFTGRQEQVISWLHAFDIFAMPSIVDEGVPQALMQAMACGLPVVTTPVGSIPELIRDNETGLFVRPENTVELVETIHRLLTDKPLAARLGEAGRRHIEAGFNQTLMLDAMERILSKAAGKSRAVKDAKA
jgi:glycosyltransferase involved in cell wall biosynthesis